MPPVTIVGIKVSGCLFLITKYNCQNANSPWNSAHCAACKAATGQMRGIDRRLRRPGVPYFVLMLSDSSDTATYFQYASSLGVGSSEVFEYA